MNYDKALAEFVEKMPGYNDLPEFKTAFSLGYTKGMQETLALLTDKLNSVEKPDSEALNKLIPITLMLMIETKRIIKSLPKLPISLSYIRAEVDETNNILLMINSDVKEDTKHIMGDVIDAMLNGLSEIGNSTVVDAKNLKILIKRTNQMSKLHQLLAVESDLDNAQTKVLEETTTIFAKKGQLFVGAIKKLEVFDENDTTVYPEERFELTTTVDDRLDYQNKFIIDYFDALLRKETTNQEAKAAINIDGKDITGELPATFLLALEKKLIRVRSVYLSIPTLQQGIRWEIDSSLGENIFRAKDPEIKFKTKKVFKHQILVDATEHHPAQIEKWEEQENIGRYITEKWSGLITSSRKAELLKRVDKLIIAVKKARQKANDITASKDKVGELLFDYIHKN